MITIEQIGEVVCNYYNLSKTKLKSRTRKRDYVYARYLVMHFGAITLGMSYEKASAFVNRDHATVTHGNGVIYSLLDTDPKFKKQYYEIKELVENISPLPFITVQKVNLLDLCKKNEESFIK